MKVFNVIRTTLLVAAVLGACAVEAKKIKLCDADGHATPAPTPAKTGGVQQTPAPTPAAPAAKPAVVPAVTPATVAADADIGAGKVIPGGPTAAPAAPVAPAGPSGPAPAGPAATPTATPAPAPAPAPAGGAATNAGAIKASFSYKGSNAGGPGTYQMVTDFATCSKAPQSMYSPVSPLDDDLTFVFRGPLTIHNIAIFDGAGGAWNRVSSYAKGGASENLVFLNNRNIDYSGKSAPQGFATADGRGNAQTKQSFAGELGAATSPNGFTVYADEKTGAEVNIFQDKKCGEGVECKGYYDKDGTAYLGWGGAKKIFITKVHMPHSGAPDMPAVWALNGQIVRSSQYGCNCRGVGTRGGCGELDIAEVIPGNSNMVATHYYKYESSTGHDTWSKRPVDAPTTYITIIDEAHGVKVLEVDDFDFGAASISADVIAKWQSA